MVDQSRHISNCIIVAVASSSRQISQHKITILAKIWRLQFIGTCASKITFKLSDFLKSYLLHTRKNDELNMNTREDYKYYLHAVLRGNVLRYTVLLFFVTLALRISVIWTLFEGRQDRFYVTLLRYD